MSNKMPNRRDEGNSPPEASALGTNSDSLQALEKRRLAVLEEYEILDTPRERTFDSVVEFAASVCGTPIALISFLDPERQWFKACIGLEAQETARQYAFCEYVIAHGGQPLLVSDARKDPRFATNPFVTGDPEIRAYAGVPLMAGENVALGSVCAIDTKVRTFGDAHLRALESLAECVVAALDVRKANLTRKDSPGF